MNCIDTPMASKEKSWEIDHKKPKAKRGSDSLRNKQPLQTKANREKSDKYKK